MNSASPFAVASLVSGALRVDGVVDGDAFNGGHVVRRRKRTRPVCRPVSGSFSWHLTPRGWRRLRFTQSDGLS